MIINIPIIIFIGIYGRNEARIKQCLPVFLDLQIAARLNQQPSSHSVGTRGVLSATGRRSGHRRPPDRTPDVPALLLEIVMRFDHSKSFVDLLKCSILCQTLRKTNG